MKLFIPALRTKLQLSKKWSFGVCYERRNDGLMTALGDKGFSWGDWSRDGDVPYRTADLPKGTVLVVDRLYIRNGGRNFDSVTFRIDSCPDKKFAKKRFWVKLADANKIEFTEPS